MADTFTIGGTVADMDALDAIPLRFTEVFGSIPTLTLQRRGIRLPGIPDPWLGKSIVWRNGGIVRFAGDVVSLNPHFDQRLGWVLTYQCLGRRFRLNWFPHTDSNTLTDTSSFNLTRTDPNYNAAKAGRAVGDILAAVLQMPNNANTSMSAGIGNYTGSPGTYALPAVTLADLATTAGTPMAMIPPRPIYFTGEKFGDAIEAFLAQWAPNHRMWIDTAGNYRFLDLSDATDFPNTTLTMGTDPIEPTELARDTSNSYPRVVVRGQPIAVMAVLKQSLGQITQNFGWGGMSSATAKANWNQKQFTQAAYGDNNQFPTISSGTITSCTTTTVTVHSSVANENWVANYWDQTDGSVAGTGHHGTVNLYSSVIPGMYTQCWSARIISNTALVAGGNSVLTIDSPLPNTTYDNYTVSGYANNGQVVWTAYKVVNTAMAARFTWQSTYPQAIINAAGTAASLVNSPIAIIQRADGTSFPLSFTWDTSGNIRFIAPTYVMAGSPTPYPTENFDIWIYMPVNTDALSVQSPTGGGYAGTANTVEGLQKTLTVTIDQWTDPGQTTQMQAYADVLLKSLQDSVVEGQVVYYGWYAPAPTFGMALSIAGKDGACPTYVTGWEGLNIPVRAVDVEWPQTSGQDYLTTMHVSNRKGVYDVSQFLRPPRRPGYSFGAEQVMSPFGMAIPTTEGMGGRMIDRVLPTVPEATEGLGMPDFTGQMVAGMDFGAGITAGGRGGPGVPGRGGRLSGRDLGPEPESLVAAGRAAPYSAMEAIPTTTVGGPTFAAPGPDVEPAPLPEKPAAIPGSTPPEIRPIVPTYEPPPETGGP